MNHNISIIYWNGCDESKPDWILKVAKEISLNWCVRFDNIERKSKEGESNQVEP